MASRPKTMVKRVTALEEAAFQLNVDVCTARPRQYAEREGNERDELGKWWREAARAVGMASIAVAILLARLEERAGLDWEALEREREQRRGLVPCESHEDNVTENAVGVST